MGIASAGRRRSVEARVIRYLGVLLLGLVVAGAMAFGQTSTRRKAPTKSPAKAQPKKKTIPLRLEDDAEAKTGKDAADNSRCHVCHVIYAREGLAVTHARAKVGCEKCHGASDAHIDDESWTWGGKGTPPDRMYGRTKVVSLCRTCHEMKRTKAHEALFSDRPPEKVCTDCHGKHRLPKRKMKWR